ncbi:hypothetical protein KAFR_0H01110 [Kazachstania africana CBS 2517]|uniref:Anoctamin transmembrane domain-containing protein n=1 Tax=Kazachstania africana (strain ATCC 22294 / BCRC 22015 / CBS 2517 / CECT 1963 / NBRC 1671 / NRRL Y-8276) TaxID=1071382 RepID=H2AYW5_KAZAF|nr:hypothetical protein KAFR_0H01110 [Kazachstania africana CBS 2517]CCF59521.1 hypothetical protein KAFR_0H01110 [Kazachstania africana CBS 2517]
MSKIETLAELDPNYVVSFQYSKNNLAQLLAEFSVRGLNVVTRPGHDSSTVYAFTRLDVNTEDEQAQDIYSISHDLNFIESVTPLYDMKTRKMINALFKTLEWKKGIKLPSEHDLIHLAQLTGNARQSLYFAYCVTYIKALLPLALCGIAVRFLALTSSWEFNSFYNICLFCWSIAFTSTWINKKKKRYAQEFGKVRAASYLFKSPERSAKYSSHDKVILKKCCFLPIALCFASALIAFQLFCFGIEIFITQLYSGRFSMVLALFPSLLLTVFTQALTMLYDKVFIGNFIKWENGPFPASSRMEKNFILNFLVSYMPLFITLFIYLPFGHKFGPKWKEGLMQRFDNHHIPVMKSNFVIDTHRYKTQMFYFTFTNQLVVLALDNILPIVMERVMDILKGTRKPESESSVVTATVEKDFPKEIKYWQKIKSFHVGQWGSFDVDDNMRKFVIQFGYVNMFSVIWPLAPLLCLMFSFIMLKADLWRALEQCRPVSLPSDLDYEEIYEEEDQKLKTTTSSWDVILEILTCAGATVAATLTFMYSKCYLPNVGYETEFEKRDDWYMHSPISTSWSSILLFAIVAEHSVVMTYLVTSKVVLASQDNIRKGKVASGKLLAPQSVDLLPVQKETNKFMGETEKEMRRRSTHISTTSDKKSIEEMIFPNRSRENENVPSPFPKLETSTYGQDATSKIQGESTNTRLRHSRKATEESRKNYDQFPDFEVVEPLRNDTAVDTTAGATLPNFIPISSNFELRDATNLNTRGYTPRTYQHNYSNVPNASIVGSAIDGKADGIEHMQYASGKHFATTSNQTNAPMAATAAAAALSTNPEEMLTHAASRKASTHSSHEPMMKEIVNNRSQFGRPQSHYEDNDYNNMERAPEGGKVKSKGFFSKIKKVAAK